MQGLGRKVRDDWRPFVLAKFSNAMDNAWRGLRAAESAPALEGDLGVAG